MAAEKKHSVSRPVSIWSDGTRLAADLWSMPDLGEEERVPGILLCHGYGGRREQLNTAYARKFAALGCVVLCFDYRGYGDSDGKLVRLGERTETQEDGSYATRVAEVREVVNVTDQVEDARSALAFLMGEPNVDPDRIGVWGSSMGAAMALETACRFNEVKALVTQVGNVNPQFLVREFDEGKTVGNADLFKSASEAFADRIALARGTQSPFPQARAYPGSPEEYEIRGSLDWDHYRRFDPMRHLDQLEAATLIIDAKDEELFDPREYGEYLFGLIRDRLPSRYELIPGQHYDVYSGEGYYAALELEMEWFSKHLIGVS